MRRSHLTHTLEKDLDEVLIGTTSEGLALVDLESYSAFIGEKADYFDLMAHLSDQMQGLRAMAWKAPEGALNFRVILTGGDSLLERCRFNRVMIASGNLRCYGQLGLATHGRLFDIARDRTQTLLRGGPIPKAARCQVLNLPPGVYSIFVYYNASASQENWMAGERGSVDYSVVLRHYPFPPPRIAPVRVSSRFLMTEEEEAERASAGVITSHARIW